jgi:hypothetical protein
MGIRHLANGDIQMTNQTNSKVPMLPATRHPIPPAPIHPLAALTTIVLDNVFGVFELVDPLAIIFTSLGVGTVGAVTTMFVQHYMAKDSWGVSVAKGLVMGIIAGVPFQVTGTAVGAILLGWAGANQWIKLPASAGRPEQLPTSDEVVEAEVRDVGNSEGSDKQ